MSSDPQPSPKGGQAQRDLPFFSFLIVVGVLSQTLLGNRYFVGWFNDDGGYLQRAMAMLYQGNCQVCSQPIQLVGYAIGWPLFLTPFLQLFGDRLDLFPMVGMALSILFVLLAADIARREFGRAPAAWLGLVLFASVGLLEYGTTIMSEPFYATIVVSILWLESKGWNREKTAAAQGVLAMLCAFTRSEGYAMIIALLLVRAMRKEAKALALTTLCFALPWALLSSLFVVPGADHFDQTQTFLQNGTPQWNYLGPWFMNQLLALGHTFALMPSWLARSLSLGLLAALFYSAAGPGPSGRSWPGFWFILGTSAALLFWPYIGSRYWLATLPIWLLAVLRVLPPGAWRVVLPSLLLLELFSAGRTLANDDLRAVKPTRELYRQLTLSRPDELVSTVCPIRAHVLSHRNCTTFQSAASLGPIARNMVNQGASILIWEYHFPLLVNMKGTTQVALPPRLELWIERCTMFTVLFKNEVGLVARLVVSKTDLEGAFEAWRKANEAASAEETIRWLEEGLRLTPDLPELRALRILTVLNLEPFPKNEASADIVPYFQQYPHDFELGRLVVMGLSRVGAQARARQVAELCLAEAGRLGDPRSQRDFQSFLGQTPAR